jgi:5-dehydro-2-deoxygluconokinase
MRTVLADCDLIVGTEEEVLIASGEADLVSALKTIRAHSEATIVLKRGPMGCIVYDGAIPADLEEGIVGRGFPIEVYNVLGAGDAFMSGFLRGWLRGEPHATSATWANACGAFAVSRLLCAPEIPTWEELQFFLTHGSKERALRKDAAINHVHWATTRRRAIPDLMAFAIDHRSQLEDIAAGDGEKLSRIPDFKVLAVQAAAEVAGKRPGYGMLLDDKYGRDALFAAAREPDFWVGKPIELPGSRPLRFEFSQDLGSRLVDWPVDQCIKVLCFYHPDDPSDLKAEQVEKLRAAFEAARKVGREILIEIIAGKNGALGDDTIARALTELYDEGLTPDWWKLEPQASEAAWAAIDAVIAARDPYCRGVLLLGLEASVDALREGFTAARTSKSVRGFAVGRTLWVDAARRWFAGEIDDAGAVADMAARYQTLCDAWADAGREAAA